MGLKGYDIDVTACRSQQIGGALTGLWNQVLGDSQMANQGHRPRS